MKLLFCLLIFFQSFSFVRGQKSNDGKIPITYTEAIGRFISEKKKVNYIIGDTLTFFNLEKHVINKIPRKIKQTYLKFVTWEQTQSNLSTRDTLHALQIWTTNFDDIRSFIFLPLRITKDNIFRDNDHICGIGYYINKKKGTAQYKGIRCGSGLKMVEY